MGHNVEILRNVLEKLAGKFGDEDFENLVIEFDGHVGTWCPQRLNFIDADGEIMSVVIDGITGVHWKPVGVSLQDHLGGPKEETRSRYMQASESETVQPGSISSLSDTTGLGSVESDQNLGSGATKVTSNATVEGGRDLDSGSGNPELSSEDSPAPGLSDGNA